MSETKVTITWNGDKYTAVVRRELRSAVRRGAGEVKKHASALLNEEGTAVTTPHGIGAQNGRKKLSRDQIFARGLGMARPDKIITTKSGSMVTIGGRMGNQNRIYWNETTGKWTQSSVPGTPPHKQSGKLQQSVTFQMGAGDMSAKIGPGQGLVYARIQELGGKTRFGTLPKRPYMKPAFQASITRVLAFIANAVERSKP